MQTYDDDDDDRTLLSYDVLQSPSRVKVTNCICFDIAVVMRHRLV